jgi:CsoR family transcriptional regulator, copper-sensing transcriptional repressor
MEYDAMSTSTSHRESTIRRLKKIEGQVRGLIRMIEDERYCIDVLHQVHAVKAALTKTESEILKDHAATCVEEAIDSGDVTVQRRKFSELVSLFEGVRG